MHITTKAIVCAVIAHGEHGAIARLMTPADGLQPGYVRGGRSRRLRPILVPGNLVQAEFRARTEDQLAGLTIELVHSRGLLLGEPLALAAIDWATALTAATLPEAQPYQRLFAALDGVLQAIEAAPSARGWSAALVRYERLLIAELGFAEPWSDPPETDAAWPDLLAALDENGLRLRGAVFADRRDWALDARERLVARLRRSVG